jgi:hypothetical protein
MGGRRFTAQPAEGVFQHNPANPLLHGPKRFLDLRRRPDNFPLDHPSLSPSDLDRNLNQHDALLGFAGISNPAGCWISKEGIALCVPPPITGRTR